MSYEEMTWEERVDWSAAYLLKGLIAGNFRSSVWMVLDMIHRTPLSQKKRLDKNG